MEELDITWENNLPDADPRAAFNPKLEIKVSLEDYEEWCRPW
jgi:hypothetical protein